MIVKMIFSLLLTLTLLQVPDFPATQELPELDQKICSLKVVVCPDEIPLELQEFNNFSPSNNGLANITCYTADTTGAWSNSLSLGDIAVRDYSIPRWTKIEIEGLGVYTVQDHLLSNSRADFDIYFGGYENEQKCNEFGRQFRNYKILD